MDLMDKFSPISPEEAGQYPSLSLAYLGDAIFELLVRRHVMAKDHAKPNMLHKRAKAFVSAENQAKAAREIMPLFSEKEEGVFRRGRNAKPKTVSKNASAADYMASTGLEALIGYLYLTGQSERLAFLFERIVTFIDDWKVEN